MAELIRAFPRLEWNVRFIGTADGNRLASLRGEPEMLDEKLWLAVNALFPLRYREFLFLRAASQAPTAKLLEEMGLDTGKIRLWVSDFGQSELRLHYLRSTQLNINASPTLFVNNSAYGKRIIGGRLVREECGAAETKPPFCGKYPVCFDDGDCRATGKLGKCVKGDSGRTVCEFRNDVSFKLTALIADSAMSSPEKQVIETMKDILPGAQVRIVKFSSGEGKKLMAKHAPETLPFIHFEKRAEGAFRFSAIKGNLEENKTPEGKSDGFRYRKSAIKENFFPLRKEKPGVIALYADPMRSDAGKAINAILSDPAAEKRVIIRPLILNNPGESPAAVAMDKHRAEEALRWLVLAEEFPKQYHQYLKRYAEDPASTYWFTWLAPIGIDHENFLRRIEANRLKINQYRENTAAIQSPGEAVIMLINNRIKVAVSNETELESALTRINKEF
ncbi:MAG: hypothetical protein LBB74_04030 [Chitinispirillales bacterium]|jgi:hypothetical protein|nr:hypothetical protein [Chitinispirillales bacterium]